MFRKILVLLSLLPVLCACGHKPEVKPAVYRELNTGEPPAKIIKVPYSYTYELARSVSSRQFVISPENSPGTGNSAKPLEKAFRINLTSLANGIRINPLREENIDSGARTHSLTVFFDLRSHTISPAESRKLHRFISELKSDRIDPVDITGYTCWLGSESFNQVLALQRAEAVADVFKAAGLDVRSVFGQGGCCYVDRHKPELNRRVEVAAPTRHVQKEVFKGD